MTNLKKESVINRNLLISVFLILLVSLFMISFVSAAVDEDSTITAPVEPETSPIQDPTTTTSTEPETSPTQDPPVQIEDPNDANADSSNPIDFTPEGLADDAKDAAENAKDSADSAKIAAKSTEPGLLAKLKDNKALNWVKDKIWYPLRRNVLTPLSDWTKNVLGINVSDFIFGQRQIIFASALGFWICLFYLFFIFFNRRHDSVGGINQFLWMIGAILIWLIFIIIASLESPLFFNLGIIAAGLILMALYLKKDKIFLAILSVVGAVFFLVSQVLPSIFIFIIPLTLLMYISLRDFYKIYTPNRRPSNLVIGITTFVPLIYLVLNVVPVVNRILQIISFEFFVGSGKQIFIVAPIYAAIFVFAPVYLKSYLKYKERLYKYKLALRDAAIFEANKFNREE